MTHTEGDFLLVAVDAQHDRLDFLIGLEHLGRLVDALGPGQLGDVHQPLDTRLQFHKRAVRHEIDHLAGNLLADGKFLVDVLPRVFLLLLQAEADTLALLVDVEHHDLQLLPNDEQLRGVRDAAPAHVGNVQQAVQAVQIDERAEVGQVLHRALANVARHHLVEQLGALCGAFLLDQLAAAQHDVLALKVQFHDLKLVRLADVGIQVGRGVYVNL